MLSFKALEQYYRSGRGGKHAMIGARGGRRSVAGANCSTDAAVRLPRYLILCIERCAHEQLIPQEARRKGMADNIKLVGGIRESNLSLRPSS